MSTRLFIALCIATFFSFVILPATYADIFERVNDKASIDVGDKVIIVSSMDDYAMGRQVGKTSGAYRAAVSVARTETADGRSRITLHKDGSVDTEDMVAVFTLEKNVYGDWIFHTDNVPESVSTGYLSGYKSGKGLVTNATLDKYGWFSIGMDSGRTSSYISVQGPDDDEIQNRDVAFDATTRRFVCASHSRLNTDIVAVDDVDIYKMVCEGPSIGLTDGNGREVSESSGPVMLGFSDVPTGWTVYYTLDGSDVTVENGMLYTEPVKIAFSCVIKALAVGSDGSVSELEPFEFNRYVDGVSGIHKAEFLTVPDGVFRMDFDAVVTFAKGHDVYIEDDDRRPMLVVTSSPISDNVKAGSRIKGGWQATCRIDDRGVVYLEPLETLTVLEGDERDFEYMTYVNDNTDTESAAAILQGAEQSGVVLLRRLVFGYATPGSEDDTTVFYVRFGTHPTESADHAHDIVCVNRYGTESVPGLSSNGPLNGSYDMLAVVGHYMVSDSSSIGRVSTNDADAGDDEWTRPFTSSTVLYPLIYSYNDDDTTGLQPIGLPTYETASRCFNMQGVEVVNPRNGVFIVLYPDGRAIKVAIP